MVDSEKENLQFVNCSEPISDEARQFTSGNSKIIDKESVDQAG